MAVVAEVRVLPVRNTCRGHGQLARPGSSHGWSHRRANVNIVNFILCVHCLYVIACTGCGYETRRIPHWKLSGLGLNLFVTLRCSLGKVLATRHPKGTATVQKLQKLGKEVRAQSMSCP